MTATQGFDPATLNHTYFLPTPIPPPATPAPAAPVPIGRPDRESGEFARAMEDYKRRANRPFPTWSEVLEVFLSLGYAKRADLASQARHKVQIHRSGPAAEQIRAILARFGGVPLAPPADGKYGFPSEPDRDRALDAVRADQGWTSVEPQ